MALGDALRQWRVRREAAATVRATRKSLRRHADRLKPEVFADVSKNADELERARDRRDHDAMCRALVVLDAQTDEHLSFTRKSTFREYADSIGVAVLIALLLRAFVVEAFKIPSGSMIPSLEVGDHIFVNKFIYGLRIPFTKIRFFDYRKPKHGEIIVFIYPKDPDKDFIKRVVALEGDRVRVQQGVVYVNGKPIPRETLLDSCNYWDVEEKTGTWNYHGCSHFAREIHGGHEYLTVHGGNPGNYPDREDYVVPEGHVFVLGDNRSNSHDSRYWGPVPIENIKGRALMVWWSGGPEGTRWGRLGHVVE